jgi:hypothetical protein
MNGACDTWGRTEMHTGFCYANLKRTDHFEETGTDERIILKCILDGLD